MTAFPPPVPEFRLVWVGAPAPSPAQSRRLHANADGVAQAWSEAVAASAGFESHLEHLAVFTVGENNTISGWRMLAKGSGNSVGATAAELVLTATCAGAISIIAAHNHPHGDLDPSEGDIEWTWRAATVCELAGVRLLDHIILPSRPAVSGPLWASMRDLGYFKKFDSDITTKTPVPQADRLEKVILADPDVAVAMNKAAIKAGLSLEGFADQTILNLLRGEFAPATR